MDEPNLDSGVSRIDRCGLRADPAVGVAEVFCRTPFERHRDGCPA